MNLYQVSFEAEVCELPPPPCPPKPVELGELVPDDAPPPPRPPKPEAMSPPPPPTMEEEEVVQSELTGEVLEIGQQTDDQHPDSMYVPLNLYYIVVYMLLVQPRGNFSCERSWSCE